MDCEKVLGERKFPTYEQLKTGLLQLIDEGKISRKDASRLLPELRESEEETTRKELLDFVRSFWADHKEKLPQVNRWVTYLEKQKVPEGLYPEEYPLTPDECVKPVEWSEKDKEMLMRCIAAIPVQGDEIMPTSYLNKLRNWLEFLPERFNLPPKQEWSEEDEKMRYFVTEAVQYRYSDRELAKYLNPKIIYEKKQLKKKLFDWLRDLRPSWKPSEEDIKMLEHIIGQYETINKNSKVMGYLPRVEELSFLKKVLSKWEALRKLADAWDD